jgi:hypothetical protein
MNEPEQTCPIADADTDTRYLAGSLTDAEAEAFEEHYFECDTCWKAVQRGAEIRSALSQSPRIVEKRTTPAVLRQPIKRRTWWPALAAAAVIVVAVGLWKFPLATQRSAAVTESGQTAEPTRGTVEEPSISTTASGHTLTASWPHTPQARTYRVRLIAEDGRLLLERELADTSIVIPLEAVSGSNPEIPIYWKVEGLNDLRVVISNYALTPARAAR